MPTPNGVNNLLQFLMTFEILPISKYKNQKWTFNVLCPNCCYYVIGILFFRVQHVISMAKIQTICITSKERGKKSRINYELSNKSIIFANNKYKMTLVTIYKHK